MYRSIRNAAFALTVIFCETPLAAQQVDSRDPGIRRNSLYTEVGGNAGDYSVNYERLIGKRTLVRIGYGQEFTSYGGCLGIGFISACEGEVETTLIPVMVSRLIGKRHMAEVGAGFAAGTITDDFTPLLGDARRSEETFITVTATIGYRWQGGGRWLVRAGFTPSYRLRGATAVYHPKPFSAGVGASFGIAF